MEFADCFPGVEFNMFLIPCTSCKLVVRSRVLIRFSMSFETKLHHRQCFVLPIGGISGYPAVSVLRLKVIDDHRLLSCNNSLVVLIFLLHLLVGGLL